MRKLLMASAALLLAAPAAAQTSPFSLEVRGRAAFPTGDFGEEQEGGFGVETGWGGSVEGIFQVSPLLGIYAGYSFTRFGTDLGEAGEAVEDAVDDASVNVDDSGLDAGVRVTLPLDLAGSGVFVKGGVVYHRANISLSDDLEEALEQALPNFDGEILEGDWSLGYQVGAGVLVPLGPRLSATVGANYTRYTPEFEFLDDLNIEADGAVSYASVEAGLQIRF